MADERPRAVNDLEVAPALAESATDAARSPSVPREKEWDVFISYSRKDKIFAQPLYAALGAYRPPKSLPVPQRYLKPFLDVSDAYGPDYEQAISDRLKQAAKLVVICSPNARGSRFVDGEIKTFLNDASRNEIVPLIIDGLPNNEAEGPLDPRNAFPEALSASGEMPLAIEYRGFDPRKHRVDRGAYQSAWFTLLANIYGHSRADIEERELKRQARQRQIRNAILAAIGAMLLTLSGWALWERDGAIAQRDRALAGRLAAQANLLLADPQEGARVPILLAAHSFRYGQTAQAMSALADGMRRLPPQLIAELPPALPSNTLPTELIFSPRSRYLAVMTRYGVATDIFDTASKQKVASLHGGVEDGAIGHLMFARNETSFAVVWRGKGRRLKIFRPGTSEAIWDSDWRKQLSFAEAEEGWRVASMGPDHRTFVVMDPVSGQTLLSAATLNEPIAIGLSPDGKFAAFAAGRRVTVFDLASPESKSEIDLPAADAGLAVAPGGDLVAVVTGDGRGGIWRVRDGQRKAELDGQGGKMLGVEFTPGGRYLRIRREGGVSLLETETLRPVVVEQAPGSASDDLLQAQGLSQRNSPVQIQLVNDEREIFVARQQGDLILWSGGLLPSFGKFGVISGLTPVFRLDHGTDIVGASASDDASRVVSFGSSSGMSGAGTMIVGGWTARIWDAPAKLEIARITEARGLIATISATGDILATGQPSNDKDSGAQMRIWSIPARPPAVQLPKIWKPIGPALLVGLDGEHIAGRTKDLTLMLGDMDAAETLPSTAISPEEARLVDGFRMSGDSRLLFAAAGPTVELFDTATRRSVDRVTAPREVAAAALSHDGRYLAVTHVDKGDLRPIGERAYKGNVALKPGELVTQVWDRQQRKWLWTIQHRQVGFVRAVSQDGRRVLVQRWEAAPDLAQSPLVRVGGMFPIRAAMEVWDMWDAKAPLSSMPLRSQAGVPAAPFAPASFDASGEFFGTAINGQTALVGSSATGEEVAAIEPYGRLTEIFNPAAAEVKTAWGGSVGFSDDGEYILTAGATIRGSIFKARYPWRAADLVAAACARLPEDKREMSPNELQQYFGDAKPHPICDGSPLERESDLLWDRLRGAVRGLTSIVFPPRRQSATSASQKGGG
jgi:hypothetical protein